MPKITIELTDLQLKALSAVCMDPQEYLQNFASVRSEQAMSDIVNDEVKKVIGDGGRALRSKDEILADVTAMKDRKGGKGRKDRPGEA